MRNHENSRTLRSEFRVRVDGQGSDNGCWGVDEMSREILMIKRGRGAENEDTVKVRLLESIVQIDLIIYRVVLGVLLGWQFLVDALKLYSSFEESRDYILDLLLLLMRSFRPSFRSVEREVDVKDELEARVTQLSQTLDSSLS